MPKPFYPIAFIALIAGLSLWPSESFSYESSTKKDKGKHIPISPPVTRSEPDSRFVNYHLPAGTAFHVLSQTPVSTAINQPDDPIEAITDANLYLGEELLIPKNTRFIGKISRLDPPIAGRDAILAVSFHQVRLDNGENLPIVSHVRTDRPDRTWGGKVTQGTKPYLSTQRVAGIGEYNKIVYGGPRAMGKHIDIPPGEHWTIILDQPLNIIKGQEDAF